MKTAIKIYAERNTGSRYLTELIGNNLEVDLLRGDVPRLLRRLFGDWEAPRDVYFGMTYKRNLGWKHAVPPDASSLSLVASRHVSFVTLTKNPYAWLLSLFRRPYHGQVVWSSFDSFLNTPWYTVGRENHSRPFPNVIVMWNVKNRAYLELRGYADACNLRYEDLLADPVALLDQIAERFSISRKDSGFANYLQSTKGEAGKTFDHYQHYYLQEKWRARLSKKAIETINAHLDQTLAESLGYTLL